MIRKQNLLILSIITIGSLFGTAYSVGTIVSDSGITTPTLTVTTPGGCSGCSGSGSFTSYNTIGLNTTMTGIDNFGICNVLVGNDGAILSGGAVKNQLVFLNGTLGYNKNGGLCNLMINIGQSNDGKYKVIIDTSSGLISVYKNGQFMQNLGINTSQFNNYLTFTNFGISPDGHYIGVVGEDSGVGSDRVIIFRGT